MTEEKELFKGKIDIKVDARNTFDGQDLLSNINDNKVKACFFDPQYRGVLDKLGYGNEGVSRGLKRFELIQMSECVIISFIKEIERVLKPSGHLFLWIDKFHLCEGIESWLSNTDLKIVDLITWDKGVIGMGYRSRRRSEYCLIIQKSPIKAKGCWTLHNIPDVWPERVKKVHPHSKPIELQRALICAVTEVDDIVLDPAAGGYSVLKACGLENRTFIGCDLK